MVIHTNNWLCEALQLKDITWVKRFLQFGVRSVPSEVTQAYLVDFELCELASAYRLLEVLRNASQAVDGSPIYIQILKKEVISRKFETLIEFQELHKKPYGCISEISASEFRKFSIESICEISDALIQHDQFKKLHVILEALRCILAFDIAKYPTTMDKIYIAIFSSCIKHSSIRSFKTTLELFETAELAQKEATVIEIFKLLIETANQEFLMKFLDFAITTYSLDTLTQPLNFTDIVSHIQEITDAVIMYRQSTHQQSATETKIIEEALNTQNFPALAYFLQCCAAAGVFPNYIDIKNTPETIHFFKTLAKTPELHFPTL